MIESGASDGEAGGKILPSRAVAEGEMVGYKPYFPKNHTKTQRAQRKR
jgi:hypothetical protein